MTDLNLAELDRVEWAQAFPIEDDEAYEGRAIEFYRAVNPNLRPMLDLIERLGKALGSITPYGGPEGQHRGLLHGNWVDIQAALAALEQARGGSDAG